VKGAVAKPPAILFRSIGSAGHASQVVDFHDNFGGLFIVVSERGGLIHMIADINDLQRENHFEPGLGKKTARGAELASVREAFQPTKTPKTHLMPAF
jgi:hypothetical protein